MSVWIRGLKQKWAQGKLKGGVGEEAICKKSLNVYLNLVFSKRKKQIEFENLMKLFLVVLHICFLLMEVRWDCIRANVKGILSTNKI